MARLFARPVDADVVPLLVPAEAGVASQHQAEKLSAWGFIPLYDVPRGEQLERLGAVIAKTRTDGALWPMDRAKRADGLARWGFKSDFDLLDALILALTNDGQSLPRSRKDSEALSSVVDMIEERLRSVDALDPDTLMALDSVVRLGSPATVMAYLESL